jgi:hypothetical protein
MVKHNKKKSTATIKKERLFFEITNNKKIRTDGVYY